MNCRRQANSAIVPLILAFGVFGTAAVLQWNGPQSIAVADAVSYVVGGVNLIGTGSYTNPFGEAEVWFPPVFPILIGIFSVGGYLDPLLVARLISFAAAAGTIFMIGRLERHFESVAPGACLIGAGLLALNPSFQFFSTSAFTQSLATCLSTGGLCVWLRTFRTSGYLRFGLLGAIVGLATLTRPEAVILLPLWLGSDLLLSRKEIPCYGYLSSVLVFVLIVTPYSVYLVKHTGKIALTNKSEVNLAKSREAYYQVPREYIDPDRLTSGYYPVPVSISSEARRFFWNIGRIISGYMKIYRGFFAFAAVVCFLLGIFFVARNCRRLLFGLAAMFAYLPVLAFYVGHQGYLHGTLPAISLLMGFGVSALVTSLFRANNLRLSIVQVSLLLLLGIGLLEQGTRYPRWVLNAGTPQLSILRDAGKQFASLSLPKGVMYESGASVGYYAGQLRRRITANDLSTLERFIHARESPPVYFAVSSFETYHPTVADLLDPRKSPYPMIVDVSDSRGRVVIYRIL
jgi:hypothetical protein